MKTISFYHTTSGKCPVRKHLDTLTDVQATKVAWVLKKTPKQEIKLAESRKKEYLSRRQNNG
jgi:hypothetical protein